MQVGASTAAHAKVAWKYDKRTTLHASTRVNAGGNQLGYQVEAGGRYRWSHNTSTGLGLAYGSQVRFISHFLGAWCHSFNRLDMHGAIHCSAAARAVHLQYQQQHTPQRHQLGACFWALRVIACCCSSASPVKHECTASSCMSPGQQTPHARTSADITSQSSTQRLKPHESRKSHTRSPKISLCHLTCYRVLQSICRSLYTLAACRVSS